MSAAIRFAVPFATVFDIISIQRAAGLRLLEPSRQVMTLAETIASTGHEKSGFPDVYDSIYHALALELSATFVTADRRHFAKAKQFGHMELLSEWRNSLSA